MNFKQQTAVRIGLVAIVLVGIFPPWRGTSNSAPGRGEVPAGYAPVFLPPEYVKFKGDSGGYPTDPHIDLSLLLTQWVLVAALTGLIVSFLHDRPAVATHNPSAAERP
jgi:hypothetical protein